MKSRAPSSAPLRLFVYGTLRTNGPYHGRFCAGALSVEPASVPGRIHFLPAGYPVLTVPPNRILAGGTADPSADVDAQARLENRLPADAYSPLDEAGGSWPEIAGEILAFDDPGRRLPPIDAFEDFRPSGPSLYRRVLLAVRRRRDSRVLPAWAYVGGGPTS